MKVSGRYILAVFTLLALTGCWGSSGGNNCCKQNGQGNNGNNNNNNQNQNNQNKQNQMERQLAQMKQEMEREKQKAQARSAATQKMLADREREIEKAEARLRAGAPPAALKGSSLEGSPVMFLGPSHSGGVPVSVDAELF